MAERSFSVHVITDGNGIPSLYVGQELGLGLEIDPLNPVSEAIDVKTAASKGDYVGAVTGALALGGDLVSTVGSVASGDVAALLGFSLDVNYNGQTITLGQAVTDALESVYVTTRYDDNDIPSYYAGLPTGFGLRFSPFEMVSEAMDVKTAASERDYVAAITGALDLGDDLVSTVARVAGGDVTSLLNAEIVWSGQGTIHTINDMKTAALESLSVAVKRDDNEVPALYIGMHTGFGLYVNPLQLVSEAIDAKAAASEGDYVAAITGALGLGGDLISTVGSVAGGDVIALLNAELVASDSGEISDDIWAALGKNIANFFAIYSFPDSASSAEQEEQSKALDAHARWQSSAQSLLNGVASFGRASAAVSSLAPFDSNSLGLAIVAAAA